MRDPEPILRQPGWAAASLGVIAPVLLAAAGCGSGESLPLGTVEGQVTYQGKPLDHGRVVFTPDKGTTGPQAVGQIQSDGSFSMETGDRAGAPLGTHVVTVHCRREPTPEEAKDIYFVPEALIPEKYFKEDQSPLRFEVKEGHNDYSIVLE